MFSVSKKMASTCSFATQASFHYYLYLKYIGYAMYVMFVCMYVCMCVCV